MPSTASEGPGEMTTAASPFSYAQAAKGRSPSQSVAPGSSKAESETSEGTMRFEHTNGDVLAEPAKTSGEENAYQRQAESDDSAESIPNASNINVAQGPTPTATTQANGPVEGGPMASATNGNSTAITSKEDDISVTANGSESGWERLSQASNTDEKKDGKVEGDGDDSKLSSWEQVPAPPPLKEAPPPSVNIWQKRAADAQNKARPTQTMDTLATSSQRSISDSYDVGQNDARKKSTTSRPNIEDKTVLGDFKPGETKSRYSDDDKIAARGTKLSASKKSSIAPPPTSDAMSWPTPDLAREEDRKKPQDRSDKSEPEKVSGKTHGKEKWVQMPYVPSAVFNTPLPTTGRRGGRPRGVREGGRGGHTTNGSISGDRTASGSTATGVAGANPADRTRDIGNSKAGTIPPKAKRASSAGPSSSREQRRSLEATADEGTQRSHQRTAALDNRRISSSVQREGMRQISPPGKRQQDYGREERSQSVYSGRREGGARHEYSRDAAVLSQPKDRAEGRPERGRGGYRGRGGHNGFGGHPVNGYSLPAGVSGPPAQQGFSPPKSQSYSEQRYPSQPQTPSFGSQREQRSHFRSTSRSQSIPNPTGFGRYPSNGPVAGPHSLPNLQTDAANMYYGPPGVMSAVPFNMMMEQAQLSSMVQLQMEYYFSLDNLLRDTFLRRHMDSQGFVLLSVLLNFNRIKQLSSDVELVRAACWRSPAIEFQTGADGRDRVRPIRDWQQWVLPSQERVPTAQNDGPDGFHAPQLSYGPNGVPPPMSPMSPSAPGNSTYHPESNAANGSYQDSAQASEGSITQTPLSAAVPEFTPSVPPATGLSLQQEPAVIQESVFPDDRIGDLTIIVQKERPEESTPKPSVEPNRTFSNGSLDTSVTPEELSNLKLSDHPAGASTNGDRASESRLRGICARSPSPFDTGTTLRQLSECVASPVFWVKDNDTPLDGLPQNLIAVSYPTFRQDALAKRSHPSRESPNYNMDVLFQFWSHFLIRNFNLGMYEEFKRLALEDVQRQDSNAGLENLITYYDASILGKDLVSHLVASDYAELAKKDFEAGRKERPAFQKLRAAWRNGALPLRDRIRIDKLLEPNLKAELDR